MLMHSREEEKKQRRIVALGRVKGVEKWAFRSSLCAHALKETRRVTLRRDKGIGKQNFEPS